VFSQASQNHTRFGAFAAVFLRVQILLTVTSCPWVSVDPRAKGACCLQNVCNHQQFHTPQDLNPHCKASKRLNNSTSKFLVQKLTVPQLVKKFHPLYGTRTPVVCTTLGSMCPNTRHRIATDSKPSYSLCGNLICSNKTWSIDTAWHNNLLSQRTEPTCTSLL